MSEFISNLDNIKRNYIQIQLEKYDILKNFLQNIWIETKKLLKIKDKEKSNYIMLITELLEYYNPKRTPASCLKIIEKLPSLKDIEALNIITEEDLRKLDELKIIYIIKRADNEFPLLTPEGLIFYFALIESKKYNDLYRLNTLIIQKYEKLLLNKFRNFILEKFINFQITKDETPSLSKKDVGIILFFLVNGSVDENKAFTRESKDSEKALNCIIQAFNEDLDMNDEFRNDLKIVPIRILQSDISVLDKKMRYPFHNEKSIYYLKSKHLNFVLKTLKKAVELIEFDEIKSRWEHFMKEYNYWRPLLRQNKVCYYDHRQVEKIEREILKLNK